MAERISGAGELPVRSSGWSEISGGYSLVVQMVHRTAARNTAAPTVKESFTVGGIACPATLALDTPRCVNSHGSAEASSIHSSPAAIHSAEAFGMARSAAELRIAPTRK